MRLPALCLLFAACGESGIYGVVIDVPGRAERVEVSVLQSCDGVARGEAPGEPIAQSEVRPFVPVEPLGRLEPGAYGLYARAWDAECVLFAAGCTGFRVEAGGRGTIRLELTRIPERGCEASQRCEGGLCADESRDAGWGDAGEDAAMPDAAVEDCLDGVDNDGDSLVDCEDPTCTAHELCTDCEVAEGECWSGNPLACDGCDWRCSDVAEPDFKLTALDLFAPAALANALMQELITSAIDSNALVWLIDTGGAGEFRTGSGICGNVEDGTHHDCLFDGLEPPAVGGLLYNRDSGELAIPSGAAMELGEGASLLCSGRTIDVTVVIHSDAAGDIPLPLRETCLVAVVSHDGNCIGRRENDTAPSIWATGDGSVAGKMTMTDSMAVEVAEPINTTLCDLLAGSQPDGFCAQNPNPGAWDDASTVRPETYAGGEPAWVVTARFAAIGVRILD